MKQTKENPGRKRGSHWVCLLFGHDFDPLKACSTEDEYCHRCGKKCHENDRWFEWRWWLKWKLLPMKRWIWKMKGTRDNYNF